MNLKLLFASIIFLSLSLVALVNLDGLTRARQRAQTQTAICQPAPTAQAVSRAGHCPGLGSLATVGLTLLLTFALSVWSVGSLLAPLDSKPAAAGTPQPTGGPVVSYLQDGTRLAGEFVVLTHAAEDLPVSGQELGAAVERARLIDPTLEHREVAGHWILRRPRL